jgi:hypothetical protein
MCCAAHGRTSRSPTTVTTTARTNSTSLPGPCSARIRRCSWAAAGASCCGSRHVKPTSSTSRTRRRPTGVVSPRPTSGLPHCWPSSHWSGRPRRRGRFRPEVSVGVRATAVGQDLGPVHPAVADQVDALRGTPFLLEGSVDEVTDQVLYWHQEHGISYFILGNDTDAKPMFPVMERVRATALTSRQALRTADPALSRRWPLLLPIQASAWYT